MGAIRTGECENQSAAEVPSRHFENQGLRLGKVLGTLGTLHPLLKVTEMRLSYFPEDSHDANDPLPWLKIPNSKSKRRWLGSEKEKERKSRGFVLAAMSPVSFKMKQLLEPEVVYRIKVALINTSKILKSPSRETGTR